MQRGKDGWVRVRVRAMCMQRGKDGWVRVRVRAMCMQRGKDKWVRVRDMGIQRGKARWPGRCLEQQIGAWVKVRVAVRDGLGSSYI